MTDLIRYRYIDALRCYAFLGVLTVHATLQVASLPHADLARAGMYGVQLFFLLSAVTLLRSASIRSSKERFPIRNFFIRRLFRVAPLFWFGIVLYFFVSGVAPTYWAPNGIGRWHYISTFFFLHGWAPTSFNSVVPGGWSIAAEMTFYLFLPFLGCRITSAWSALTVGFYSLIGSFLLNYFAAPLITRLTPQNEQYLIPGFLMWWFPSQVPVFLLGFVVYYCLHNETVTRFLAEPRRPIILFAGAVYAFWGLTHMGSSPQIPIQVCFSAIFAIIILAVAAHPFAVVVNSLTCGLGKISYSCYITHFAALTLTANFLKADQFAFLPPYWGPLAHFIAVWLTALSLTVAASAVTYFAIERPGMKMGSLIIRRFESSNANQLAGLSQV